MSSYNIPLDEMYFTLTQVENMKNNSENDYSSEFNASNMKLLLEEAGKLGESSDSKHEEQKEEAPKKKGLFGRKKK